MGKKGNKMKHMIIILFVGLLAGFLLGSGAIGSGGVNIDAAVAAAESLMP